MRAMMLRLAPLLAALGLATCGDFGTPIGAMAQAAPGYAAGTTGGAGGKTCYAHDQAEFTACVAGDIPAIVRPVGDVRLYTHAHRIMVGSNKTIDGDVAAFDGVTGSFRLAADFYGLSLQGVHNVILRNIYVRGSGLNNLAINDCSADYLTQSPLKVGGCAVPIQIISSDHVWVDHISCSHWVDKCITISANDGPTPIKQPDFITVSNSRFSYVYYAILVGINAYIPTANLPPTGHVTFYQNLFSHVMRRSPRCSGDFDCDVVSNMIWAWGGPACSGPTWGFGPSSESADMLLRGNLIQADPNGCPEALNTQTYVALDGAHRQGPPAKVTLSGNLLLGGATITGATGGGFVPPYSLPLLPIGELETWLHDNAGVQPNHLILTARPVSMSSL